MQKTPAAPVARPLRLVASGLYLPPRRVTAEDLDAQLGLEPGWVARKTGVLVRYFSDGETASQMGAKAACEALRVAGLAFSDIGLLVCASGGMQQMIPCTASLIQEALGETMVGTPCFDVNATCLSFVVALDLASYLLSAGAHRRIMIVSTEVTSCGLDWNDPATCTLFGDGAVAYIFEGTEDPVGVVAFRLETYSAGAHLCEIPGGGSGILPTVFDGTNGDLFTFQMQGERLHKLASELLPGFMDRLFTPLETTPDHLDAIIPHQAGRMPLVLMERRLGLRPGTFVVTLEMHGNTMAAAIPMALHLAMARGQVSRGQRILLLGTSAGFSMGGLIWQL